MTAQEILAELQTLGSESYRKVMRNHGVQDPFFGVKIEELKKYRKRIKKDHELALALYASGVYDAQYLAGLIADETRMSLDDVRTWLAAANCPAISEVTVAWVASECPFGWALAREWIEAPDEGTAATGWATLSSLVSVRPDPELNLDELGRLIDRVAGSIHRQPNRVRYAMNSFLIAVGSCVPALTDRALDAAARVGEVHVDMGNTSCRVPDAAEYIRKVRARGTLGKKRKSARC